MVLKACPGSEAIEAVDLQWEGVGAKGSKVTRQEAALKQDRMRPVVSIRGSLWKSSACVQ